MVDVLREWRSVGKSFVGRNLVFGCALLGGVGGALAQPPVVEVTAGTLLELRDRIAEDTPDQHTVIELVGDLYPAPDEGYPFGHTVVDLFDKHWVTLRGNGRRIVAKNGTIGGRSGVSVGGGSTNIAIENVILEYELTAEDPVAKGLGLPPNHIHYGSAASGVYICGAACGGSQVTDGVVVADSFISGFPGAGVGTNEADHVVVRNNVIWNNGFLQQDGHSGVSFYRHKRRVGGGVLPAGLYDNEVVGNRIFGNANLVGIEFPPYSNGQPLFDPYARTTDGNGVIVDQFLETGYDGTTLVANNEVFDNGAVGVHLFGSTNVDVLNNTLYENGWRWTGEVPGYTSAIDLIYWSDEGQHDDTLRAEIDVRRAQHPAELFEGSRVRIWNNLVFPRSDLFYPGAPDVIAGCEEDWVECDTNSDDQVAAAIVVAPARSETANFRLQPGTVAVDSGLDTTRVENGGLTVDRGGESRLSGLAVDLGAWELGGEVAIPSPTDLRIDVVTETTLALSWGTPSPVDGYEVWVDGAWTAWTAATSYTLDGLQPATDYSIEIFATAGADKSMPAGIVGTTAGSVVPAPEGLRLSSVAGTSLSVLWDALEPVDGYEVWLDGQWNAWTEGTDWTLTDLTLDSSYFVEIVASRDGEKSARTGRVFKTLASPNIAIAPVQP